MRNTQPSKIAHVKSPSNVQGDHDSTRSIGQIFFRITKDNDPASFASGKDLVQHNGDEPWCLVPRKKNAILWRLLLQDGLVTASTKSIGRFNVPEPISNVGDPFIIDPPTWIIRVTVRSLRSGDILPITVANPYRVQVGETRIYRPYYQGRLRCHFERSSDPKHAGTDTFVIRVTDVLSPIKYVPPLSAKAKDSSKLLSVPREGELLLSNMGGGTVWSHTVTNKQQKMKDPTVSVRAWHILSENEVLAGSDTEHVHPQSGRT